MHRGRCCITKSSLRRPKRSPCRNNSDLLPTTLHWLFSFPRGHPICIPAWISGIVASNCFYTRTHIAAGISILHLIDLLQLKQNVNARAVCSSATTGETAPSNGPSQENRPCKGVSVSANGTLETGLIENVLLFFREARRTTVKHSIRWCLDVNRASCDR